MLSKCQSRRFSQERRFLDGYEENVLVSFSCQKLTVPDQSGVAKQYLVGTLVAVRVSEFYSTEQFNFEIIKYKADVNGRFIIIDIKIENQLYTIANIYGPNNDDPEFFQQFGENLLDFSGENIILAGDFNLVLEVEKDKQGGRFARTLQSVLDRHINTKKVFSPSPKEAAVETYHVFSVRHYFCTKMLLRTQLISIKKTKMRITPCSGK